MISIDTELTPEKLRARIERAFEISAGKIRAIEKAFDASRGSPVFTAQGVYTAREWTEWTQGFMYGSALLQYDATGEKCFLEYGKRNTVERMAPHLTHTECTTTGSVVSARMGTCCAWQTRARLRRAMLKSASMRWR